MPSSVLKAVRALMDGMEDGSLLIGFSKYEGVMGMGRSEIGGSEN